MAKKYYHHLNKKPAGRWRKLWLVAAVVLAAAGVYLLLLVFAPMYDSPAPSDASQKNWNEPVSAANLDQDRLYIPRLSLNLLYKSGGAGVLHDALWHRYPERGDPQKGGNFILAGHRLEIGLTPSETKRRSPLYHVDKIQIGDYLYADFNGKRYQYQVAKKYGVAPTQIEIEAPSETPKMTLYTCTLQGEADGREVVEATLIKEVDPKEDLLLR